MSHLTRLALRNRASIILATLATVIFGVYATISLRQELIPSLQIPGGFIVAAYPGATPQTIETDVTRPIEDAVKGIQGVTAVKSVSSSNVSQVQVEWEYGTDSAAIEAKIRSALDGLATTLPTDVDPKLTLGNFDDVPIIFLAVSSDQPPEELASRLKTIAVPRLAGLDGVRSVDVAGQQAREIVITTRAADLDRLNVDASQIPQILMMYKAVIPAGQISESGQDQLVQVGTTLTSVEAIQNLQLQGKDGPVTLRDVADVVDTPVATTSIARVNGKPSLSLSVVKTPDANTVTVARAVNEELPTIADEVGGNVVFDTVFDQAPFIEQSVHDLGTEGGLGLVMAVIVILLFLWSLRSTIITAISIPLSLMIAIISLWVADYTLNLMTLSALTVAVGRVVDDSIVVIENIKRHVSQGEEFGAGLIISAVKEVAVAVTASTITTVAVFAPITFVSGQAGQLFRPFGMTVTVALIGSLLVSLTIVPVLASWFMRPSGRPENPDKVARREAQQAAVAAAEQARREKEAARAAAWLERRQAKLRAGLGKQGADEMTIAAALAGLQEQYQARLATAGPGHGEEAAQTRLQSAYLPALRLSLRHPVITLVLAALIFGSTVVMSQFLKTDFIGDAGQTSLQINQTMPPGTTLAETNAATLKVEQVLAGEPSVQTYSTTVGGGSLEDQLSGQSAGANKASIGITLKQGSLGVEIAKSLRKQFAAMTDIGEVEVVTADGATGSTNLAVDLRGPDVTALTAAADQVQVMLRDIDGLSQVTSDLAEQQVVLQVAVNEAEAARYGMSQVTIGMAANQALRGTPLTPIVINGTSRDVVLRSRPPITTKAELEALPLPVTQKQTMDAQQAAGDELKADSERQAEAARREALRALDKSEAELRKGKAELQSQISQLTAQLRALQSAPPPVTPTPPMVPDPTQAQIAELSATIGQLQGQLTAADKQLTALDDQREKAAEQQAQAQDLQDRQEAIQDLKAQPITLNQVAVVNAVPSAASIRRVDGERAVTVTAVAGDVDLRTATLAMQKGLADLKLPAGVSATIGGVSQDQADAFRQLFLAMAAATALVYIVMVATFRSLLQPVILLVSIPFAATGALGLLLITGTPLGVPAMIGLLMLIGIVVTNAIVLIDLVNHYRAEGASVDDAVIHGARLRLRPIIMTALATIMALAPMGVGLTGGGVFISKSLAVVVIGGLISSTALTLLLVPVLYHLLETGKERLRGRRSRPAPPDPDEDLDGLTDLLDSSRPASADGF